MGLSLAEILTSQREIQRLKWLPPVARQGFQWKEGYIKPPSNPSAQSLSYLQGGQR